MDTQKEKMLAVRAESKVWHQEEMQRADVRSEGEEPSSSSSGQCWANELSHISSPLWEPSRKHGKQRMRQKEFGIWTSSFSEPLFYPFA